MSILHKLGFWRVWLILSLAALAAIGGSRVLAVPDNAAAAEPASLQIERATVYNCDGTDWAFRFARMANNAVSVSYAYVPVGSNRALAQWSAPVSLGGVVLADGDVSGQCINGWVFVFAHGVWNDSTMHLYERHGQPGDLANGYGGGFTDDWYHWR